MLECFCACSTSHSKDKMIFFKILTFYDVSNLQKPSWIKGQIACHCNIILYTLFRIKFFQLTYFFYITVLFYLFTVLSLAFTPSSFEAHGSSWKFVFLNGTLTLYLSGIIRK